MSTVVNPDNGEFIVLGTLTATSVSSSGSTALTNITLDSTNDIDLNDIPTWTEVSDDSDPNYAPAALAVQGGAWIGGNSYVGGTFVAAGDVVTLGSSAGTLTLNSNISSHVVPSADSTYDLGTSTAAWNKAYTENLIGGMADVITSPASVTKMTDMIQTGTAAAITLPNGEDGFIKNFITISAPAAPVTVTPTSAAGFTSITFTNVGDSAQLIYHSTGWHILSQFRASVT